MVPDGSGELADWLGPVSGFALSAPAEPTWHIAGDTVWCDAVRVAIDRHRPDVILVFAGGARFLDGDPITMTADDIAAIARHAPEAAIVAVHLDAINHCVQTRADLRLALATTGVLGKLRDDYLRGDPCEEGLPDRLPGVEVAVAC